MMSSSGELNLGGDWRFALDSTDTGLADDWQLRHLDGCAVLPGSLSDQGIGDPVTIDTAWTGELKREWFESERFAPYRVPGNVKTSFWLQPDTVYVGPAWYQRDVDIPDTWEGRRLVLSLERPHISSMAWIDGVLLGTRDSLSTAHVYTSAGISPGKHTITLRIDNRVHMKVGVNSHSVSDHTQGNWNGVVGAITIEAKCGVWIDDLQIYANTASQSATVRLRLGNCTGRTGEGNIKIVARSVNSSFSTVDIPVTWNEHGGDATAEYSMDGAQLWDEFNPAVYCLKAVLTASDDLMDVRTVNFGLREVGVAGTQVTVNGRPIFLRGTLECCIFPKTGYPPTDYGSWLRIFTIARDHGLNMLRFHSWCPPEAAFNAADDLGVYLHVECSSWANGPDGSAIGQGDPLDTWLYDEADRILKAYGNHPSFILLLYGNEPTGKMSEYLGPWVEHFRAKDRRRLYAGGAGWPEIPEEDCHVIAEPRIFIWGAGLSRLNSEPPATLVDYAQSISSRTGPVITHEMGEWCAFPNFAEIEKYTGHLKAKNFEVFRDFLTQNGMADQAADFLFASGKLQALCYKEDIESALRTQGLGGFQLLDLHDFPGQGTALVGVLDAFWDSKGYITAQEYSRFCNSTVPLARLAKRVFTTAEELTADIEIAHFGPESLNNATIFWRIEASDGKAIKEGHLGGKPIETGRVSQLGSISVSLADIKSSSHCKLVIGVRGSQFVNDWDIWVYPDQVNDVVPANVLLTTELSEVAAAALESGGTVVWCVPKDRVRQPLAGPVELGFSSIFWNTAWTDRMAPHTLGILCDPMNPLLEEFPTQSHSNWQWWYPIHRAAPLLLDGLPVELRPVVQVIDDWTTSHRLGLVVEAAVGAGRLIVTGIDLTGSLENDIVTRQLRLSILNCCSARRFGPAVALTLEQARSFATTSN